jgi:hypothetical protein
LEEDFHSIRNSGAWHFRWDFAISLSARTDKAIVSPRARAGPVIRPERHSKILERREKLSAPVKEFQAARTNIIRRE